jgi:cobalt-zinc-cadmium efflux system protein
MEFQTPGNTYSEQLFEYRAVEKRKLLLSLAITAAMMVVEVIGGVLANSIALVSDAGHMFTHAFAIGISLVAIQIARRPPCHHRTFGLYRAEILAAFMNGLFLLLIVGVIIYEAVLRLLQPRDVLGLHMLAIALIGLAVNVASIYILHGSTADLNVRSVFYHLIGDAASSIGIVGAAIVISRAGTRLTHSSASGSPCSSSTGPSGSSENRAGSFWRSRPQGWMSSSLNAI